MTHSSFLKVLKIPPPSSEQNQHLKASAHLSIALAYLPELQQMEILRQLRNQNMPQQQMKLVLVSLKICSERVAQQIMGNNSSTKVSWENPVSQVVSDDERLKFIRETGLLEEAVVCWFDEMNSANFLS